jgi:hypothetical protein
MNDFIKQYQEVLSNFVGFFNHTKIVNDEVLKEFKNRLEWFNNYVNMTENCDYFHNETIPELKRGNIVLAELGFNVGLEFGGRHYCIVLRDCSISNQRVLILPITTQKPSDYEKYKETYYIQFDSIKGMDRARDSSCPDGSKRWCNILNTRSISKSRIVYPIDRGIISLDKNQVRMITHRLISQIALRRDLLDLEKRHKKLQYEYNKLEQENIELKKRLTSEN